MMNSSREILVVGKSAPVRFVVAALFVVVLIDNLNIIFLPHTIVDFPSAATTTTTTTTLRQGKLDLQHPFGCNFEDDFLIQLYNTSSNTGGSGGGVINISIVSEYFQGNRESKTALLNNINKNRFHARFIYVVGESRRQLATLLADIGPDPPPFLEVFYAPGGVTYRHLFGVATLFPDTPFLIHNADIDVGDASRLLNACSNLDEGVLVGSRTDILRPGANCREYKNNGSFDVYLTNSKDMDYNFLKNLRFPPSFWGAENVVASQIPKKYKANLCPYWQFDHHHKSGLRDHRVRINSPSNSWAGSSAQTLGRICNISTLESYISKFSI